MKWITREKVRVDRVACPWLIKNFVDPDAEFVFLPHDTDWAKIDDGTVFDVPNCDGSSWNRGNDFLYENHSRAATIITR